MNLGSLIHLSRRLSKAMQAAALLRQIDPPLSKGEIITLEFLIGRTEPASIREIVQRTEIAQSWISVVVKSLMRRGWVDVSRAKTDRRTTTVRLKPELLTAARDTLSGSALPVLRQLAPEATEEQLASIERSMDLLSSLLGKEVDACPLRGAGMRSAESGEA